MSSALDGLLVIDKPQGLTSHGVVSRVRRWCGTRRVGHAGTLDPMATGVLVLGIGRGTKLLTYIVGVDKTYSATIRLGASTPTDDADSEPDVFAPPGALAEVSAADIESGVAALRGDILQTPSAVSAIKVDGQRAYARVRAGEKVELRPRPVTISAFVIKEISRGADHIDVDVVVTCSSGTYIRALARDLGNALGVYGHLTVLRRLRVGPFSIDAAGLLPEDPASASAPALQPLGSAAGLLMPTVELSEDERRAVIHGQTFVPAHIPDSPGGFWAGLHAEQLIAVLREADGGLRTATGIALPG